MARTQACMLAVWNMRSITGYGIGRASFLAKPRYCFVVASCLPLAFRGRARRIHRGSCRIRKALLWLRAANSAAWRGFAGLFLIKETRTNKVVPITRRVFNARVSRRNVRCRHRELRNRRDCRIAQNRTDEYRSDIAIGTDTDCGYPVFIDC